MGMHNHAILLPGMILYPPYVDNCQYLETDGKSWWLLTILLWEEFPK